VQAPVEEQLVGCILGGDVQPSGSTSIGRVEEPLDYDKIEREVVVAFRWANRFPPEQPQE
jgi:ligand-binding sensor protein